MLTPLLNKRISYSQKIWEEKSAKPKKGFKKPSKQEIKNTRGLMDKQETNISQKY